MLASAYPSGWLVGRFGAQPVLCLMALFPLLMCATSSLIREQRRSAHAPADASGTSACLSTRYSFLGCCGSIKPAWCRQGDQNQARACAAGTGKVEGRAPESQPGGQGQGGEAAQLLPAGQGAPRGQWQHLQEQLWTLWQAICMPGILLPALFVFVWQVRP